VSILPTFANMVDYSSMKHSIVPRMTALCIQAGTTSVSYVYVRSMPLADILLQIGLHLTSKQKVQAL